MRAHNSRFRRDDGFSMVELLMAMALSLVIVGGMIGLVHPAGRLTVTQPDAIDMHQRLRAGASALVRDLRMAGAGFDSGPAVGSLIGYLPPIVPRRLGAVGAEASGVAHRDTITLMWMPLTASQTITAAPFAGAAMDVAASPGCPSADAACGLAVGMNTTVFDNAGHFDLFSVSGVAGSTLSFRRLGPSSGHAYAPGALTGEVVVRTYYFDPSTSQLRQYNGDATDTPVIDDVSTFGVEYFGTPEPPTLPMPATGSANCLYDASGARASGLQMLAPEEDGLAALPLNVFTDGPWCGGGGTQFDADLLRIRRVRITLGVRAPSPGSWRRVSDLVVSFDVSPRNLAAVN